MCTFSPRKGMGRPKNGERRERRSNLIPRDDAMKAPSPQYKLQPTSQATSSIVDCHTLGVPTVLASSSLGGPTLLAEHDLLRDLSYDATNWAPNDGSQGQQLASYTPYEPYSTTNPIGSTFQDRNLYLQSTSDLSNSSFAMTGLYPPRHPSLDLFTRLSNVQMELWKRRDRLTKMPEHQDACVEIDDFIQTTSEICDIATSATGMNHSTETPTTSANEMQGFYFQLMMAVSAALDILSSVEAPTSHSKHGTPESQRPTRANTPISSPTLVRARSSLFTLASLRNGEHLNKILTLTTLDYYLGQIGAVLANVDISTRIDGLHQGVEGVVGRSQYFRHLISSSLQELRGGA
ncbi:MAG: hypothetical protein LQ337_002561 [Flavoplaca oasis]|nr:MAG: hypothetical protein LQ337_002561 [Flavoplaca oasis]